MDIAKMWALVGDFRLWGLCGIAFGFGAAGGVIRSLTAERAPADSPAAPRRRELMFSALRLACVGAVAAVAVLYVAEPDTAPALIGGSLVAGYAGQTILEALEARTRVAIAEKRADENQRKAEENQRKAEDAVRVAIERDTALRATELALGDGGPDLALTAAQRVDAARGTLAAFRGRG